MKYETELERLLPELKKYLGRLSWRLAGYIEDEEIFSRAIITVCEVVEKKNDIKKPEKFIKGVFWRAVQNIQGEVVRERNKKQKAVKTFKANLHLDNKTVNVNEVLNSLNETGNDVTGAVWNCLVKHNGDNAKVISELNINRQTFFYHKRKLKEKYKKLKMIYTA